MLTRIGLFLATNLAVLFVLNLMLTLLGLTGSSAETLPFLVIAGVMGMSGSLISLLLSKSMAKRSSGARIIETPANEIEQWLVDTVRGQAERAEIGMPEVAIFPSAAPNAFATGANKNASLVAVSNGLLETMNRDEVEAVLAHEVSHVGNGDMVTLSLVQGVVNTFVMVLAQAISALVDGRRGGYRQSGYGFGGGLGYRFTYMITQTVLGFLATVVVRWFSRWREFRADAGSARLVGAQNMIAALERLRDVNQPAQLPAQMQALGVNGGLLGAIGLKKLTMTHPPLDDRIAALREGASA